MSTLVSAQCCGLAVFKLLDHSVTLPAENDFMPQASKETVKMIDVHDDFFKADLCTLIEKGTENYQWRYWRAVPDDSASGKTFVSLLFNNPSEENFSRMLWRTIQKGVPNLLDFDCYRIIANGQVKGQNIDWHTDHGDKTVLYYPIAWKPEWGGSTYFKIANAEQEIHYKQNRIVTFDSSVLHYASCPAVENILRVSIAFNLRFKGTQETKARERC